MEHESRVRKSLLNARVNLIFYFLTLLLSFFSRKIFLNCLGADFIGLTGTLGNLLGFLNLAELGIGSAIGYLLYKPLFDHDQQRINEIISVMGYLYRWIGFIIFAAGCILACFLPFIFSDTGFSLPLIYFAYFSFLASTLIGYIINYRQNLLGADQKFYVVTAYFQTGNIIKTLVQMMLAYYTGNYYYWVAIEFLFGIIYSVILNWKINQTYPWLHTEVSQGRKLFRKYPEVIRYTRQLFVHRIAPFVQYQTTPFFIYSFVSLKIVAYYGNYSVIIDKLSQLVSHMLDSVGAGVGNLVAEGNKEKIISVFWELLALRYFICSIFLFAVYHLINPFITLWLGEQYLLGNSILAIILCNVYILITRGAVDVFLFAHGLFYDIWASISESSLTIVLSVVGGYFYGFHGVLLGPVISMFINACIWKPYFLFHSGFHLPVFQYWKGNIKFILLLFFGLFVSSQMIKYVSIHPSDSYIAWVGYASIICFIHVIVLTTTFYPASSGMRRLIVRFINKNHE